MTRRFWLIQKGTFKKVGKVREGLDGIVNLDYMGCAEFEWGAIPEAYQRLMHHFKEYKVFGTKIYTPEHDELMVFCRKGCASKVIEAIQEFIEFPYDLREESELENVEDTPYNRRHSDFWWCIDNNDELYGDWMAFIANPKLLVEAIRYDVNR